MRAYTKSIGISQYGVYRMLTIGRAGRDGLPSETILFYNIKDLISLNKFVNESGQPGLNREKLNRMKEYAEAQICRRRILLNYFGESSVKDCHNCDVCKSSIEHFDGTVIVQKALSAILHTREMVSMPMLIGILRGSLDADIASKGYQNIKSFGIGRDVPASHWHKYLLQMLQMGFFEINYKEGNRLVVTDRGRRLISDREKVDLVKIQKEDIAVRKISTRKDDSADGNVIAQYPSADERLFAALRQFRLEQAEKRGVPAYVIMNDKTLHSLVQQKPTSKMALVHVYGIGQFKRKLYGESLINIIKPFVDEDAHMSLSIVSEEQGSQSKGKSQTVQTQELSYMARQKQLHENAYARWTREDDDLLLQLYEKGKSVNELSEYFKRNNGSICSRIKKLTDDGN